MPPLHLKDYLLAAAPNTLVENRQSSSSSSSSTFDPNNRTPTGSSNNGNLTNRIGNNRRSNGIPRAELDLYATKATIDASSAVISPTNSIPGFGRHWWAASTAVMFGNTGLGRFGPTAIGETVIVSVLLIAFLQGMVALIQYRNNPKGQLMIPPGKTYGIQHPRQTNDETICGTNLVGGGSVLEEVSNVNEMLLRRQRQADTNSNPLLAPRQILNKMNQWLFLLIPWISRRIAFVLERNAHLFHLGTIMSLITIWDAPRQLWFLFQQTRPKFKTVETAPAALTTGSGINVINSTLTIADSNNGTSTMTRPLEGQPTYTKKNLRRIVVIGDSLAVGLGSVNVYDENRNNSIPFCRIENVQGMDDNSESFVGSNDADDESNKPVFPRVLAQTLADLWHIPVHWRSAGVDGGDIKTIEEYCFDVIQEQVDKKQEPDIVFIVCGVNDMKYFVGNPFQRSLWPRKFQLKLHNFIERILNVSPNTTVILPSVTTQMFHRHSPMNMFPLAFVVDCCVGIWDYQKKLVSHHFPTNQVLYLSIKAREIYQWYKLPKQQRQRQSKSSLVDPSSEHHTDGKTGRLDGAEDNLNDLSLIAADGIHPNARCYACWARDLGMKISLLRL